jgi:hypothetical protein
MQKTSLLAMLKPNSINKLQIEWIDEPDGTGTLRIDWDEKDPDLQWWTDLGPGGQETFIIESLREALDCYVN